MIDKSKILIILSKHAWTYKYIKELGYNIHSPYYGNCFVLRIFRELFFRLRLPGKLFWYRKLPKIQYDTIILYEALLTKDYLRWISKHNETKRIIILYSNPVSKINNSILQERNGIEFWTYDKFDSEKYNMTYLYGGGYFPQWKIKKENPSIDVFYVGKDKNRLKKLNQIEKELNRYGAKTFFYITWERGWQKRKDGIHKPFLPYEDVLKYLGKSYSILHLMEGAQQGITIRIQESLIHKIKLITDDKNIVNYDFYNPNNIFILGIDDFNRLKAFLNTPFEDVNTAFYSQAYYDQMIDKIINFKS